MNPIFYIVNILLLETLTKTGSILFFGHLLGECIIKTQPTERSLIKMLLDKRNIKIRNFKIALTKKNQFINLNLVDHCI